MNKEQMKEIETSLIDISKICDKLPDRYRDTAFEFLSKKLSIQSSTPNYSDNGKNIEFDEKKSLVKLAEMCDVTTEELENVISLDGDNLNILYTVSVFDSVSNRRIIGSMLIMMCYHVIFSQKWVTSTEILEILKKMNINDKGGNFAANLKMKTNLILKNSGENEYMLTTPNGREIAKHLLRKLSKLKPVTKEDLIIK